MNRQDAIRLKNAKRKHARHMRNIKGVASRKPVAKEPTMFSPYLANFYETIWGIKARAKKKLDKG